MKPEASFAIVILAAGGSSRLGKPKQLVEVGGQTLVARAVDAALASSAWPVIVVIGAEGPRVRAALARKPVLIVENPGWAEGMASSIRAGIAAARQVSRSLGGVVIALCDQPGLSGEAIDRLIAARAASTATIVSARYAGTFGAPVLFTREHFADLERLSGDQGARALVAAAASVTAVDLPELARDVDTPADLERLEADPPGNPMRP